VSACLFKALLHLAFKELCLGLVYSYKMLDSPQRLDTTITKEAYINKANKLMGLLHTLARQKLTISKGQMRT
jgi:hypothetical protein